MNPKNHYLIERWRSISDSIFDMKFIRKLISLFFILNLILPASSLPVKIPSFGNSNIGTQEVKNNLRFPGQYFEGETELHQN